MILKRCLAPLSFALILFSHRATAEGWRLSWQDEFDGLELNPSKWTSVIGGDGFGNNELQYYTDRPKNVYIDHGMLVIQAIQEIYTGAEGITRHFTSARLETREKFSQAYGRFEARISLPSGSPGVWSAYWLLGDGPSKWPAQGEIDVIESIGEPSVVYGTIHGPGYSGAKGVVSRFSLEDASHPDAFHVYAIEWDPQSIRWYIDEKLYKTVTPSDLPASALWVYNQPFYLILNLAVGGDWPGSPTRDTAFPQRMYVDYVRAYLRETTE